MLSKETEKISMDKALRKVGKELDKAKREVKHIEKEDKHRDKLVKKGKMKGKC